MKKEFGFYPESLNINAGSIKVRDLCNLDKNVRSVYTCNHIKNDWIYAPPQQVRIPWDGISTLSLNTRVFGLPKTHSIEITTDDDEKHLEFHVWVLSFFLGMRLTTSDWGFLDATPVKPHRLNDFSLHSSDVQRAIALAENFWVTNRGEPRNAQRIMAAIHALFLGQYPNNLQFEKFTYLYAATDACYALTKAMRGWSKRHKHSERIERMCEAFGMDTPYWGKTSGKGDQRDQKGTEVSILRNGALHECLFADAPLGFALHPPGERKNLTLQMRSLVCRLLVALIGGDDDSYLKCRLMDIEYHNLNLCLS